MKPVNIQSRSTDNRRRSKYLYFISPIFYYLFRSKQDLRINFHLSDLVLFPLQKYFYQKPTLPVSKVIVGFFLQKINNHFIYTFNF